MNPRRDSCFRAARPTARGRSLLAIVLPALVLLLVGALYPQTGRAGAEIAVLPDRTVKVDGILVTHEKMLQFDAMQGPQPEMKVVPFIEVPGPLPLPGTAASAIGSVSEKAPDSTSGVDQGASPAVIPGPGPLAPPLMASFLGVTDPLTVIPPDTHGAVGPAHVVSITNGRYQVFNKAGATVFGPITLQAFWAALGTGAGMPANAPFDPKVIYDQYSGRFIAVTDGGGNTATSWIMMAISVASDPTLGWFQFAFDADAANPGQWADFPHLGVNPDNVYISHNRFTVAATPAFTGTKYLVVTKASMLAGGPLVVSEFNQAGFGGSWAAAHAFGPTAVNYIMNQGWTGGGTTRFARIQSFTGPPGAPVLTDLGFVSMADYSFSIADAPQSGCAVAIETNDTRLQNLVLRGGRLWATHTVGMPAAGAGTKTEIAWYEIDPALANPGGTNPPVQQGRVSNPVTYYSFPSIAVNDQGCVALGFAGSDAGIFGSGFYTMRRPADPPGTMQPVGLLRAGVSSYVKTFTAAPNRWGDYSSTMIDPADGRTFWTTQEYAEAQVAPFCPTNNTGRYATWWGSFACGCVTNAECNDGLFCNGAETCDLATGNCVAGAPPTCDDLNPCTVDSCNPGLNACANTRTETLYGTDGNPGNLYRINQSTGAATLIGNMGFSSGNGLATDPTTGILYAGRGGGFPYIYTVDPITAAATFVGDTGLGTGSTALSGLDFDPAGSLYASVNIVGAGGTGGDHLAIIDKTSAATVIVGPFGGGIGFGGGSPSGIEGIVWDYSTGTLYGASGVQGGAPPILYTIDATTGLATPVGPIVDGGGTPAPGGVVSIEIDSAGVMYGGEGAGVGALIRIDKSTGVFTPIGPSVGGSLGALAFLECGCFSNAQCDDGQFCNGAETCDLTTGACVSGAPPTCDDLNPCTVDTCNPGPDVCENTRTETLYGTDGIGGNLFRIDQTTGTPTFIGNPGIGSLPSLAADPTTGILYSAGPPGGPPALWTLDPNTAAAAPIGPTGLTPADSVAGLDFDSAGNLYASVNIVDDGGTGGDHLAVVDKFTGFVTVIGPFGAGIGTAGGPGGIEGIVFSVSGTLYGASATNASTFGPPTLYRIDRGTGLAATIGPIVDGGGAPVPGGVASLEFDAAGTLYGGTARGTGNLIRIDPASGVYAPIGPAFPGRSLAALAFLACGCFSNAQCDDGHFCNGAETCDLTTGACVSGASPTCDDLNPCTVDSCNPGLNACENIRTETLYGTDAGAGNLYRISTSTGASSLIGSMGIRAPGLAADPTTGVLYAGSFSGGGPYMGELYTVDPNTATTTHIGSAGAGVAGYSGLDFDATGNLYATVETDQFGGTGGDTLARVDKSTGAATIIGAFGGGIGTAGGAHGIEAIVFSATGVLYGASPTHVSTAGLPALYTINPLTGLATLVGPIVDGGGTPVPGGVASLEFDEAGVLYGGTSRFTGDLITIDPTTGIYSLVGPSVPGRSLGALAFLACGCFSNAACDDGQFCNGAETCDLTTGSCVPGASPTCDDLNPCTADSCNPGLNLCENVPIPPPGQVGTVSGVQGGVTATFSWGPIPAATHYNTYRGAIPPGLMRSRPPGAEYDHTCFESDDAHGNGATTAIDGATPAAGSAFYYLMDGEHGCGEGSLGNASSGAPRPNPLPCPTPP